MKTGRKTALAGSITAIGWIAVILAFPALASSQISPPLISWRQAETGTPYSRLGEAIQSFGTPATGNYITSVLATTESGDEIVLNFVAGPDDPSVAWRASWGLLSGESIKGFDHSLFSVEDNTGDMLVGMRLSQGNNEWNALALIGSNGLPAPFVKEGDPVPETAGSFFDVFSRVDIAGDNVCFATQNTGQPSESVQRVSKGDILAGTPSPSGVWDTQKPLPDGSGDTLDVIQDVAVSGDDVVTAGIIRAGNRSVIVRKNTKTGEENIVFDTANSPIVSVGKVALHGGRVAFQGLDEDLNDQVYVTDLMGSGAPTQISQASTTWLILSIAVSDCAVVYEWVVLPSGENTILAHIGDDDRVIITAGEVLEKGVVADVHITDQSLQGNRLSVKVTYDDGTEEVRMFYLPCPETQVVSVEPGPVPALAEFFGGALNPFGVNVGVPPGSSGSPFQIQVTVNVLPPGADPSGFPFTVLPETSRQYIPVYRFSCDPVCPTSGTVPQILVDLGLPPDFGQYAELNRWSGDTDNWEKIQTDPQDGTFRLLVPPDDVLNKSLAIVEKRPTLTVSRVAEEIHLSCDGPPDAQLRFEYTDHLRDPIDWRDVSDLPDSQPPTYDTEQGKWIYTDPHPGRVRLRLYRAVRTS